jgi:hypothetical protein
MTHIEELLHKNAATARQHMREYAIRWRHTGWGVDLADAVGWRMHARLLETCLSNLSALTPNQNHHG